MSSASSNIWKLGHNSEPEGGEQNVGKEKHEGGVKVDELPVKVDGWRRTAPGEN